MLSYYAARTVSERHRARRVRAWFRAAFRAWSSAASRWARARVIAYRVNQVPQWLELIARISRTSQALFAEWCRMLLRGWYNHTASEYWIFCRHIIPPGWSSTWTD